MHVREFVNLVYYRNLCVKEYEGTVQRAIYKFGVLPWLRFG